MAAPSTIGAAGYYRATGAGFDATEAVIRMRNATRGTLAIGDRTWRLSADPDRKRLEGKFRRSVVSLRIANRTRLAGKLDGEALELVRSVLQPIAGAELAEFDAGPSADVQALMDATPDYEVEVGDSTTFWYAFGPVLYRGRLDGTARVLGIASDPGPSECLPFARRTLIGDSGQKTQGFLTKLGLTRSYALVNAFAVAMRPGARSKGLRALRTNAAIAAARHRLYDRLLEGGALQAIVAFGDVAHEAYDLWAASNPAVKAVPRFKLAHPAGVDREASGDDAALRAWRRAIGRLRKIVTPDDDGQANGPNYGDYFTELDYARIPRRDLPPMAPLYIGDDSWGRAANPRHNNCCMRPRPDDSVSLDLTPPQGQGRFIRYKFHKGELVGAKYKNGRRVAVDSFGIPRD
ncbi:MAG: hypothetical protein ACREUX_06390 [Burkholderiales bacterium]